MDRSNHGHEPARRGGRVPLNRPLKVLKFGGTSVGAPERLRRVVDVVRQATATHRLVVVASAASGVTDALVGAWDEPGEAGFDLDRFMDGLNVRHMELAGQVLSPASLHRYEPRLRSGLLALRGLFQRLPNEGRTPALRDEVLAVGERVSVPLVSLALMDAGLDAFPVDAAALIRTDASFGEAAVDLERTQALIRRWHLSLPEGRIPVVTGFIGSTDSGQTTTLGRGGSDYSAALLASAMRAAVLERWTDIDGVYTEDPRTNKNAKRLACIILEEAWAWNHAGKLGMHRKALDPLVEAGIPVSVRCTETPDLPGTLIVPAGTDQARAAVAL
jgi:aspartate kinase